MAPEVASAVAKEVPLPLAVASTSAQGSSPLVVLPTPPVWPLKIKPPEKTTEETPAAGTLPSWVPRKSTDEPTGFGQPF